MREIKFRAWDAHNKNMLNGVTYDKEAESDVVPWIFMQYIGVMDRNGVEIYEGDILFMECFDLKGRCLQSNTELVWSEYRCGFRARHIDDIHISHALDDGHSFKIIGNIHENPELLEAS